MGKGKFAVRRWAVVAAAAAIVLSGAGMQLASASENSTSATTTGCGKAPTLTSGAKSIQSSGSNRRYILDIPTNYDRNHPYRLIFGYHWLNGTADNVAYGESEGAAWAFYGQKQLSKGSTIFVAPQGIDNGWANSGGRDVTLTDDILQLVESNLCVDTSQVFAMGWSYGGSMSYSLACNRPDIFRAVVVYSGANMSGCNGATKPMAYFGIHGTHDSVLNVSNGRSLRDTFVKANGCTNQSPREPGQNTLTHIITTYSGCRPGYPVQWAAFDGDHSPKPVDGSSSLDGNRTWTSAEAFKFLAQFESTTPSSSPSASASASASVSPSASRSASASVSPSASRSASASASPSASASVSASSGALSCNIGYVVSAWSTGLTASVTIANTGNAPINGWTLAFTLPGGQSVTSGWSATFASAGGGVTATNLGYNGTIAPRSSTTIGFQASHSGNTAKPSSFTLNGAPCTSS